MTKQLITRARSLVLHSAVVTAMIVAAHPAFAQLQLDPYCVTNSGNQFCQCASTNPCSGGTAPGPLIYMEWWGYTCPHGGSPTYHIKTWNAANTWCSGASCANPDATVGPNNWVTNLSNRPYPDDGEIFYWQAGAYCPFDPPAWGRVVWFRNGPSASPAAPTLVSPLPDLTVVDSPSIQFTWKIAQRSTKERVRAVSDTCSGGPPSTTYLDFEDYFWNTSYCNPVLSPLGNCTRIGSFPDLGQTIRWYASGKNDLGTYGPETMSRVVNGVPPGPATMTNPSDGVGTGTPGTSIRFTWNAVPKIVNYKVLVAKDPGFSTIFKQATTTSLLADITGFADDGTQYWWKVVPHNCAGDATVNPRTLTNKILTCTAGVGTGTGQVSSFNDIDTCSVTSNAQPNWYLYDISRRGPGKMPSTSAVETRAYISSTISETIGDIRPSPTAAGDNIWNASSQAPAVDAHVNAGLFYDYLFSMHILNLFDGAGASMVSLVGLPTFPGPVPNALWDDTKSRVTYTISSGAPTTYGASADMVGFVWGNAVTDRASTRGAVPIPWLTGPTTRGLVPAWESGAVRSAFADWMGTAFEASRAGDPNHAANWTIGDPSVVIRDLQTPSSHGQPDTYRGPGYLDLTSGNCTPGINDPTLNRDCGALVNSGVPNKMFYLLAAGGTHNGVTVTQIGLKNAMALALKANRFHWGNSVTFQSALNGMVAAAQPDSNQVNQVKNAWAAVGVGTLPSISVSALPVEGGTVTGGGSYSFGASATVTATAAGSSQFINWTENGAQVSTNSSYTFTVNGSRALVANFAVFTPAISVTPTFFSFGSYSVGQTSPPQTFMVKNLGSGPLILGGVSLGGLNPNDFELVVDNCSSQTLALNAACTVQARFAPTASGPRSTTLSFPSNDPEAPVVYVELTGAVLTIRTVLVMLPNADAGPNQGSPTPFGDHYFNVDDDPHDGDSSMISFPSSGYREVFTLADQLLDSDVVTSVKVRWAAQRGSGSDWSGRAGLVVDGQEFFGPTVQLAPSYQVREETFARNPASNQTWTVAAVRAAKVIYQQVTITAQLPRARLSEIVLEVTVQRMPNITVATFPAMGGSVSGGGLYPFGSPVTVVAAANAGFVFINWTEAEVVVSPNSSYAFTAGGNRSLVANFALNVPDIRTDPASVNFGPGSVGEASPVQYVTVTNQGPAPLAIGALSITGGNPYDFSLAANGCAGQVLSTSSSCSVQVGFTPKSIGTRSATLSIVSDDPDTPQLGLVLSGSAQTVVYDLIELPNGDAWPNEGSPTPAGAHWANVDDEPNDGDSTHLAFATSGMEVFTVADQLHDTDVITGVKVRWVAKRGSGDDWSGMAGLIIDGQEYFGPVVQLPLSYSAREEVYTTNPATGQPWTVQAVRSLKIAYRHMTITTELPKARLSEIVLVVSARRTPFAGTLTELPNADVGPNQGSPTPSGSHWATVDDEPNDGDTSILSFSNGSSKEVFSVLDQLLDTDLVTGVTVRWTAKRGSGSDWQGRAGIIVGAQEYFGPSLELLSNYTTQNESYPSNPANGQPWTVQDVRNLKLVYEQVTATQELPRAKLTNLVLVVSVQRMPVLVTLTEKPNSDAGPNQGAPVPSGAHWAVVDENPHDSDTTILKFASAGSKEVFTKVDLLQDADIVQNVKVRWVAKKGSGSSWQARAGLVVGGQEYYGETINLTSGYVVREETFTTNPATGQPWTVADVRNAKLIYQQVTITMQLPRAFMTQMLLVVTVERAP